MCLLSLLNCRYMFFLQVKQDILHGRLPVSFEDASELFAYAVQCEYPRSSLSYSPGPELINIFHAQLN